MSSLLIGVLAFIVGASVLVLNVYGGEAFWPALVAQFPATLGAVLLAFEIESLREQRALERADDRANQARVTEARKRLLAVKSELEKNQTSIGEIADALGSEPAILGGAGRRLVWQILHPQLLDGAWAASGERLGDVLADYELVSDLSIFYGRLEELRWRLRYRTQARSGDLDVMSLALAQEMTGEVKGLLERVTRQEQEPGVLGVTHVARVSGTIRPTGTLTLEKVTKDPAS